MNRLSENEFLMIFNFLDNDSMWNAMRTCKRWAKVFRNSSRLLKKFKFSISDTNKLTMISDIAVLEVNFKNMSLTNTTTILDIPEYLKCSVEVLELNDINITIPKTFDDFFSGFTKLKDLKLKNCSFEMFNYSNVSVFPSLTTVSFQECSSNTYNIFKKHESITKLIIINFDWLNPNQSFKGFNELAATLPNLDHIVTKGGGTLKFFYLPHFAFKIRILEASTLSPVMGRQNICSQIFYELKGYLKELYVHDFYYDFTGLLSFKYIIEEMKLEKLYFANTAYILNGEKQYIEEYPVFDSTLANAIEMTKHFPGIRGLKFKVSGHSTKANYQNITRVISQSSNLFNSLQTFEIVLFPEKTCYKMSLTKYLELYKSCKNIHKLTLNTSLSTLNTVLCECLPQMTTLNEIELTRGINNHNEIYTTILNYAPGLKKLCVKRDQIHLAKEFFEGSQIEICELPRVIS